MENPAAHLGCGVFLYPSSLFTQQKKDCSASHSKRDTEQSRNYI